MEFEFNCYFAAFKKLKLCFRICGLDFFFGIIYNESSEFFLKPYF